MDLALSRRGSLSIREQLAAQIEIKILAGELPARQRLPSVRSLARRLKIHPNTVATVYRLLARDGLIECERGSGAFVSRGAPPPLSTMRSLEDAVHQALTLALHQGLTPSEIRGAVARWLAAQPPTRLVVVDTNPETAELLVQELRQRIDVPVSWCTLEAAARDPGPLASALAVTWPFHLDALQRATGIPNVAVLTLKIAANDTRALRAVPRGGLVLVISHSPRVLRYALGLLGGVRGDDVTIRCYRLADRSQWQDLLGTADLIYVDAMSAGPVRSLRDRGTREFRLVTEASHADIRQRMALPASPRAAREAGRTGRTRTGDADGLRRSGLP